MHPLQVLAVLFCCLAIVAVKMSLLMAQGISLLMALLVVYLIAVVFMMGLQHRARQSFEAWQISLSEAGLPTSVRGSRNARLKIF